MKKKIIFIRRKKASSMLPIDLLAESVMKIGASFTSSGDIAKGISFEEEKKYMPDIIGYPPTDPAFIRESKNYFINLEISVPYEGQPLNISFDETSGMPLNVVDFIKHKFALANPAVAATKEVGDSSAKYDYFIEDPDAVLNTSFDKLEVKKTAYKEYIKLAANPKKVALVKKILNISTALDEKTSELEFEEKVLANPSAFMSIINDPDIEIRVFIQDCVSSEVIKKVGNSYLDGEAVIGSSVEEAILYLKDKKNSEHFLTLKARLDVFHPSK